jgi:acyl dehydratase
MSAAEQAAAPAPEPLRLLLRDLKDQVGRHLGYSRWRLIDQARVDDFAEVTEDDQWIHVDRRRAALGPFKTTIVHGYLTLSLAPVLLDEVLVVEGCSRVINYGLDYLRYPAPLAVGSAVRMGVELAQIKDIPGGVQATLRCVFEAEGEVKPCCVAEILFRYYE